MKVKVDEREAITIVTIDRAEVHNAVDSETAQGLEDAVRAFEADPEARVLILTILPPRSLAVAMYKGACVVPCRDPSPTRHYQEKHSTPPAHESNVEQPCLSLCALFASDLRRKETELLA